MKSYILGRHRQPSIWPLHAEVLIETLAVGVSWTLAPGPTVPSLT